MIIKQLKDEDFTNYRLPSMVVGFPSCTFKCEKECGCRGMCQNSELAKSEEFELTPKDIVDRYMSNPITKAMVCGGLEPLDSFQDLYRLLCEFRSATTDDFVIYTGYTKDELKYMSYINHYSFGKIEYSYLERLMKFPNVIIKYGRYVPNQTPHYDEILGISLASDNQYAEKIS